MFKRSAIGVSCACLVLLHAAPARSQGILELSDGRSAVIPSQTGYLAIDFKDASIGTRLHYDFVDDADPIQACGEVIPVIANHREVSGTVSFSAQKGKRALFDKGQFTPGVDIQPGFAWFWEDRQTASTIDCNGPDGPHGSHGYSALYLGFAGSIVGNDTALVPAAGVATLDTQSAKSAAITAAFNRSFGHGRLLGVSASLGKDANSPGDDDPLQVCVQQSAGVDKDGHVVSVADCKDRYLGPLHDFTTIKSRIDFSMKIPGVNRKAGPGVGVYTSLSTVSQTDLNTVFNFAIGPTIHPKGKPRELIGAFLIEARDFSNANGKHPTVKERWSARLYAALPF